MAPGSWGGGSTSSAVRRSARFRDGMSFGSPIFRRATSAGAMRQLMFFFAIMGPGIITQNVDNDAGGIATYSLAGAGFGYSLLWTLIPITVALFVVQEMAGRLRPGTRPGPARPIREPAGGRTTP